MDQRHSRPHRTRFGAFELDLESGELRRAGVFIRLPAQPTAVLSILVLNHGRLVTREEIGRALWHDRWAEFEQGINTCISQVRGALGDHADSPAYVETVPRRGYRFIAPVEWLAAADQFTSGTAPAASVVRPEAGSAAGSTVMQHEMPRRRRYLPAAVVAGLFIIAAVAVTRGGEPAVDDPRIMLAVLPFEHLHADSAWGYLGEGITDELITLLANADPDRLGVIARTSSAHFRTGALVTEIGRALGVEYVVEGSVRSGGDRVRITAQLIRVSDQSHVWAQTYDRTPGDALAVERDVARRVTGALSIQLAQKPENSASRDSGARTSPARLTVLEGRFLLNRAAPGDVERALALFGAAVGADSLYAPAWTGLALAGVASANTGADASARARSAAQKAVLLDDNQVESHLVLASFLFRTDRDWDGAEAVYRRALRLAPGRADGHHAYAMFLAAHRRYDEAIAHIDTALRLDPISTLVMGDAAYISYLAHDYEAAVRRARRVLEFDPDNIATQSLLVHVFTATGHSEDALRHGRELGRIVRGNAADGADPTAGIASDMPEFWGAWIGWWRANATGPAAEFQVALGFAGLGQPDSVIAALTRGLEYRTGGLVSIAAEPAFDPLHDDPRFRAIVDRVGLAAALDQPPPR